MERMTYEKHPRSWNRGKYPTKYTSRHTFQEVVARLAAYEDTGFEPGSIDDLLAAHEAACEKLGEYKALREKLAPPCYCPDVGDECAYQVHDGDDEPIERCKECPLCYVDKQRHQQPPNAPLSLEELRKMDGEPVWVASALGEQPMWYIVDVDESELKNPWDVITLEDWDEGYPYKAYRRKPEEGTT